MTLEERMTKANELAPEEILKTIADIYAVDVELHEAPEFIRVAAQKNADQTTKIQELEEEIREFQHLFEGFSIEKYTNPEFFTSSTAKQYCYSVTMKDMEESFNKFQALKDNT